MKSHRVTIPEAVQLTERSRRSLYRDMGQGRLAYHVGPDNRRRLDVSELIRAYGALPGMPEAASEAPAISDEEATPAALLAQMLDVMREQSKTLAAQREEMAALREESVNCAACLRLGTFQAPAPRRPPPMTPQHQPSRQQAWQTCWHALRADIRGIEVYRYLSRLERQVLELLT